jgi:hypothetical protein
MAEYALGWLGWTEPEAMAADVNAIAVAMKGRFAMLRAVFGGEEEEEPLATLKPGVMGSAFSAKR